jgi:ketosteroid isomerase-like protein
MKKLFSIFVILLLAASAFGKMESNAAAVAAVTQLENDQSKATQANDISFVQKNYADDWTGGFSGGIWTTKESVLNDAKDSANNKMTSDQISDLKVRAYGNTAIATYTDSYDGMVRGEHRVKTVLSSVKHD